MMLAKGAKVMINRLKEAGLILPALLTLVALGILVSLGNWQMERKAWKADLIKRVNERVDSPAITFEELVKRSSHLDDIQFQPVKVRGTFDHSQERHYFLPLKGKIGWHVITPLILTSGEVVLVDRGFVPDALKEANMREKGLVKGVQDLQGLVRLTEVGNYFSPLNDVRQNKWYVRDLSELYSSLKFPDPGEVKGKAAWPFMIDQSRTSTSGEWPQPGVTKVNFSDKHLGYAMTWYGLALTLIGVFIAFAFSRLSRDKQDA